MGDVYVLSRRQEEMGFWACKVPALDLGKVCKGVLHTPLEYKRLKGKRK